MVKPLCLMCLVLASCTQFPDLDNTLTAEEEAQDYPTLLPLSQITSAANSITITEATTQAVQSKLDTLKAKAEVLRNPVLSRAERRRLLQAIDETPARIKALFPQPEPVQ